MTAFDDRERAFEAKFQLDEEMAFKVNARRGRLLGLWAAAQMGLTGPQAETYARGVVDSDLADSSHDAMLAKLRGDLHQAGKHAAVAELSAEMDRLLIAAREQLTGDLAAGQGSSVVG